MAVVWKWYKICNAICMCLYAYLCMVVCLCLCLCVCLYVHVCLCVCLCSCVKVYWQTRFVNMHLTWLTHASGFCLMVLLMLCGLRTWTLLLMTTKRFFLLLLSVCCLLVRLVHVTPSVLLSLCVSVCLCVVYVWFLLHHLYCCLFVCLCVCVCVYSCFTLCCSCHQWQQFVRSLLRAGVQPTLDSSAETFMSVQCASPGRGGNWWMCAVYVRIV